MILSVRSSTCPKVSSLRFSTCIFLISLIILYFNLYHCSYNKTYFSILVSYSQINVDCVVDGKILPQKTVALKATICIVFYMYIVYVHVGVYNLQYVFLFIIGLLNTFYVHRLW